MLKFGQANGYLDILNEVASWKVITVNSLYSRKLFPLCNRSFRRKINELESEGFLKTVDTYKKSKVISLTEKGREVVSHGSVFNKNEDSLYHDIIATNVLTRFIDDKVFSNGFAYSAPEADLSPDGVLFGEKNGTEYSLALEIELTQKSRSRVVDKFVKYSESKNFNYVLYVTSKETIYNGYKKICEQLKDDIQRKIIILVDPRLNSGTFNYKGAKCFFKNKDQRFEEIFDVQQYPVTRPIVSDPASPRHKKDSRINMLSDAKIDHPLSTSFDEVVNLR